MSFPTRAPLLVLAALLAAGCATPSTDGVEKDELARVRDTTLAWRTVEAAEAAGYRQFSPYVPHHGVHYRNPAFANGQFVPEQPPLLVFVLGPDGGLTLGAVEYSLPARTSVPPDGFAGDEDRWRIHEASCHYIDGLQIAQGHDDCPARHPDTGMPYAFWHPDQWTLHVWVHEENPDGVFVPTNHRV